jgi:uncharacterized integral membrane protein
MAQVTAPPPGDTALEDRRLATNGTSPAARRSALRAQERDRVRLPATESRARLEPRGGPLRRRGRRTALYVRAAIIVGVVAVLIALIAANTRSVELSWVVGSGEASLVWVIVSTAVVAWLVGIATGALLRRRSAGHEAQREAGR